jgi:hypothetical protein
VDVEIVPEPTPEEREALLTGLERLLAAGEDERVLPLPYRSAWRRTGLLEAAGGAVEHEARLGRG